MRIAALTNVTDESRTMLCDGLTSDAFTSRARTNDLSVISALPFTF
jgi:TolB-like protein